MSKTLLSEAATHLDMTFVQAPSSMACTTAPLRKLWLWLRCALAAWPNARLIGKADDDVWAHLAGIVRSVQRSLSVLREASPPLEQAGTEGGPRLYWGFFSCYSWDLHAHRPVLFNWWGACRRRRPGCQASRHWLPNGSWYSSNAPGPPRNATIVGPFPFAKGPFYLLSRSPVEELMGSERLAAEVEATIASSAAAAAGGSPRSERTHPWEDTFLGMALARYAADGLHLVHAGSGAFVDAEQKIDHVRDVLQNVDVNLTSARGPRRDPRSSRRPPLRRWHHFAVAPSQLIWHGLGGRVLHKDGSVGSCKQPSAISLVDGYARDHGCELGVEQLLCSKRKACAGQTRAYCAAVPSANRSAACSSDQVQLTMPAPAGVAPADLRFCPLSL